MALTSKPVLSPHSLQIVSQQKERFVYIRLHRALGVFVSYSLTAPSSFVDGSFTEYSPSRMLQSTYAAAREPHTLKKTLSIIQANRLYLATMLLVVSLGAILQSISFSWGLLLTELLFILLPTLWMLRHNQIDIRESSGLKKTRASLLLVAMLLGGGAWLVTSLVEILMVQITGYIPPTPAGMLPSTSFQAALIFVGLVIAAPICEEILFRGTIQPAYQKHTTRSTGSTGSQLYYLRFTTSVCKDYQLYY